MPAPGASSSYIPHAASGASSRNGDAGIQQPVDPLTHRQLAERRVPFERFRASTGADAGPRVAKPLDLGEHVCTIRGELGAVGPDRADQLLHVRAYQPQQSVLKPQSAQRQTACIR